MQRLYIMIIILFGTIIGVIYIIIVAIAETVKTKIAETNARETREELKRKLDSPKKDTQTIYKELKAEYEEYQRTYLADPKKLVDYERKLKHLENLLK